MDNTKFLNEIRAHVGVPTVRMKASRTKKMTKRGTGIIAVLIVASLVVSATLLIHFGGNYRHLEATSSLSVDGFVDGSIQDLGSVQVKGGDVLEYDHYLENFANEPISVSCTSTINEIIDGNEEPITQDEIVLSFWSKQATTSEMNFGPTGGLELQRLDNVIGVWWLTQGSGCFINTVTLVVVDSSTDTPFYKITYDRSASPKAHYATWNEGSSVWNAMVALTLETEDPANGILINEDLNYFGFLNIRVNYNNLPESFDWAYQSTSNVPGTLTVPTEWTGDMDFTHLITDGLILTEINFPVQIPANSRFDYVARYSIASMIAPSEYNATVIFDPTP